MDHIGKSRGRVAIVRAMSPMTDVRDIGRKLVVNQGIGVPLNSRGLGKKKKKYLPGRS